MADRYKKTTIFVTGKKHKYQTTMGWNYLNDLFGKFRKRESKYSQVEKDAIKLLRDYVEGRLSHDEFDSGFCVIHKTMNELNDDTVDSDTPLWLNQFIAFRFINWHQWRMLVKIHDEHPEKFASPESQAQYQEICAMDYDGNFMQRCRECLMGLKAAGR